MAWGLGFRGVWGGLLKLHVRVTVVLWRLSARKRDVLDYEEYAIRILGS